MASTSKSNGHKQLLYAKGDHVVYPTHGVGKVIGIEKQVIAGFELKVYVISFEADKMILRVPVDKAKDSGLRKLSTRNKMETAVTTLKGRARAKRTMWSRRAQEYVAKINSGDPGIDRRGCARPAPRLRSARPVLQRAPDVRGGARASRARAGAG